MRLSFWAFVLTSGCFVGAYAQDNYEIQVYASPTVPKGATRIETHHNFTFKGSKNPEGGTVPTHHAFHETLEITHGFTDWFESAVYVFSSINKGRGWQYVGSHFRPRVRAPDSWNLPVGLSLSTEFGYRRAKYVGDSWAWEIRPVIDKEMGKFYWAVNPVIGKSFKGPNQNAGFDFAPGVKTSYKVFKNAAFGMEYYGGLGALRNFEPLKEQEHQFVPTIDFTVAGKWDVNFGVGVGVTRNTDHLIVKMIVGRRVGGKKGQN
ncbi:MAG: hypothetical protein HYZ37_15350 [Candidatus Solibacter usitatus]|nr:hypothetical protein [Candidatus Solibacter usitatus]